MFSMAPKMLPPRLRFAAVGLRGAGLAHMFLCCDTDWVVFEDFVVACVFVPNFLAYSLCRAASAGETDGLHERQWKHDDSKAGCDLMYPAEGGRWHALARTATQ